MSKSIMMRTCLVAVAVAVLVLAGAAPAMAGKGPKKSEGGRPASPGQSSSAASRKGSPPGHARTNAKPAAKPGKAKPTRTKPDTAPGTKGGRRLARGHGKGHSSERNKKAAPASARRTASERGTAGGRVLGLRMEAGAADAPVTDAAGPALFPRPSGEALPFSGGDVAAMLFIGMMMITIGGLIWRAPNLIDKPRRSRDISL